METRDHEVIVIKEYLSMLLNMMVKHVKTINGEQMFGNTNQTKRNN